MKELIPLNQNNSNTTVSAKDLYDFLDVSSNFTTWCKRMFEYGFEEGKDFIPFLEESTGGRPLSNFALTLDCAKEISMIQRTEKGKQARRYFIECEKIAKSKSQFNIPSTISEALRLAADQAEQIEKQQKQLEEQKPKVLFADSVTQAYNSILVRELAVILAQNGIEIGEKRLYSCLRDNGFLVKREGKDKNTPTQRSIEMGLFTVAERTFNNSQGSFVAKTTYVTGKGQQYFVNKFLSLNTVN